MIAEVIKMKLKKFIKICDDFTFIRVWADWTDEDEPLFSGYVTDCPKKIKQFYVVNGGVDFRSGCCDIRDHVAVLVSKEK